MVPPPVPPELPPSVEEAYRKKCIQLKTRLAEIEEANDASRQRIERLDRTVQKGRLERAFLLEQLAKRTSTNVEDSEGSPSPPPTPKEKPLRTKRGHRKPDFLTSETLGNTFISHGPGTISPSSDAFSHTHHDQMRTSTPQALPNPPTKRVLASNGTNGPGPSSFSTINTHTSSRSHRPRSAFDVYCEEQRSAIMADNDLKADGEGEIEALLAKGWTTLSESARDEYAAKVESSKPQAGRSEQVERGSARGGAREEEKSEGTEGRVRTHGAGAVTRSLHREDDEDVDVDVEEEGDAEEGEELEGEGEGEGDENGDVEGDGDGDIEMDDVDEEVAPATTDTTATATAAAASGFTAVNN